MIYKNIQGLRALAALMVVASHIYWPLVPMRSHWSQPFVSAVGPGGVDLFFVISGFVVFLSADRLGRKAVIVGRWRAFREFAVKRVFRIYPAYWVAFAVASLLLLTTTAEIAPPGIPEKPLWKLLLLIDQPNNRIGAAWTLQFEMYFYTICAAAILIFPRRILLILAAWFAVIFLAWVAGVDYSSSVWLWTIVLEFAFGIVIALLVERKMSVHGLRFVVVGIGGLLIGAAYYHHQGGFKLPLIWRVICFGLPSAFIVYGFVAMEIRQAWTFSKGWIRLGDSSYSLYLWHYPLFAVMYVCYVNMGVAETVPAPILAACSVMIAIAVGFISFHQIERRFNKAGWVAQLAGVEKRKPPVAHTVADLKTEALQN
ncbi:acyltransferase family protein [Mesorhizobium calcicola]|uniref:Acyltransferase family protein n=1 Tax=Mesorhizobium calcicola TaxID=1300310 RepID=A0ABW4WLZ3_9HYPH